MLALLCVADSEKEEHIFKKVSRIAVAWVYQGYLNSFSHTIHKSMNPNGRKQQSTEHERTREGMSRTSTSTNEHELAFAEALEFSGCFLSFSFRIYGMYSIGWEQQSNWQGIGMNEHERERQDCIAVFATRRLLWRGEWVRKLAKSGVYLA